MEIPPLYEYQIPHFQKIIEILKYNDYVFDLSMMGTGKSIVLLHLMRHYGCKFILCAPPVVIKQNWEPLKEKYGLAGLELITINKLRGENNDLLYRHPKNRKRGVIYEQTDFMTNFNGMIILDEIQMAKNDNLSSRALKELIRGKKTILLSGTLIDKISQIDNYMEIIGHPKITHEFFISNFVSMYCSKMTPLPDKYTIEDLYFFGAGLPPGEPAKVPIFCKLIDNLLLTTTKKIIVAAFFVETILALQRKYRAAAVIYGETPNEDRTRYISQFQEPNLKHRLIIANANIISTGINLDDEDGRFPRVCIMSPNYYTMNTKQLFLRFSRANTKSITEIKIIYTHTDENTISGNTLDKQEILDSI